jgi:FkbM family methyltransferase
MQGLYEIYVADCFDVTCIKNDCTITPYLRTGKLWGDNMEKFVKELYEPDTNMIDIGAHIGTFSLIMSKYLSNNCKIYSFEPVFYDILVKNINDNNLDKNIIVFNKGLSNKNQSFPPFNLDITQNTGYGCFSFKKIQNEELKFTDHSNSDGINFNKLDDFNFENVSFIKLDVEFFENEILEGALNTLLHNKPTILIELFLITPILNVYHDDYEAELVKNTTFSCFSLLSMLGYICFPIFPETGEFLFVHKSKTNLIEKASKLVNE